MLNFETTDSDLLFVPGGQYAVLRRLRERVLAEPPPSATPVTPARYWYGHPLGVPVDPWARPAWDDDTRYLPLYA